jgi:glycosyltransferase involved in cell wall biosynthesis
VTTFYDEGWREGATVDAKAVSGGDFDVVVFFQVIPNSDLLRQLRFRNVTIVPMFDSVSGHRNWEWFPLLGYKFVNFCRALHRTIVSAGGRSLSVQYFPKPSEYAVAFRNGGHLRAFFWQRGPEISWNTVKRLIGRPGMIESVHLHMAPDPGGSTVAPDERERRAYQIMESRWFSTRHEYLAAISKADIFFAPRIREGIGLSFLEAMAQGACVVGANLPTMNEYIEHGKTGLLYDPLDPRQLDFSCTQAIGVRAREAAEAGYAAWLAQANAILEFVEERSRSFTQLNNGSRLLRAAMGGRYRWQRLKQRLAEEWRRFSHERRYSQSQTG